jgi:hypothetical protein
MSSEATPSRRRQTALAVVDAYNKWSLDAIMAIRTDDCLQVILPSTSYTIKSRLLFLDLAARARQHVKKRNNPPPPRS